MRIGILSQWFDPEPGPASLPGALARALRDRGHEVQVVTGFPNYPTGQLADGYRLALRADELMDGVRVRRTALYPSHDASVIGRIVNWASFAASSTLFGIRAFRSMDVVWISNSPITMALPALAVARVLRKPTVLHVLDLWPDNVLSSGLVGRNALTRVVVHVLALLAKSMYRTATIVAAISPGAGRLLEARGVDPAKLEVIPLWAEEGRFYPGDGEATRTAMGVPPDRVVVLYAGALGGTQEIETLIHACASRADDSEPIEVWVAGSGVREASIEALMQESHVPTVRFRFLGRVPMEEMAAVMHAADLHFIGLRDDALSRVTMPSKLQATMASARPVVIAVRGDTEDVVLESKVGFAAAPGQAASIAVAIDRGVALGRPGLAAMGLRARAAYEERFSLARGAAAIEASLRRAEHSRG